MLPFHFCHFFLQKFQLSIHVPVPQRDYHKCLSQGCGAEHSCVVVSCVIFEDQCSLTMAQSPPLNIIQVVTLQPVLPSFRNWTEGGALFWSLYSAQWIWNLHKLLFNFWLPHNQLPIHVPSLLSFPSQLVCFRLLNKWKKIVVVVGVAK